MTHYARSACVLCASAVAALSRCSSPVAAAVAAASRPPRPSTPPVSGQTGDEVPAGGPPLGFPVFATKNTTRVAGGDAIADAAGDRARHVSRAHARVAAQAAVILAEVRDWRTGLAASVLAGRPIRAPILFADGDTIPDATKAALDALQPTGSKEAGGAQVIRVGTKAPVEGYKTTDVSGRQPGRAGGRRRPPAGRGGRRALGRGRRRLARIARSTRCPRPAGRPSPATRCCG